MNHLIECVQTLELQHQDLNSINTFLQEDKKEIRWHFVPIEFEEDIDGDGVNPEDSLGENNFVSDTEANFI